MSPCHGEDRRFESDRGRHVAGIAQFRPKADQPLAEARASLNKLINNIAGIAQLARASPCQGEGRGFESRFPLKDYK